MGKPAVPAPYRKVPAANGEIVRAPHVTVPASGSLDKFPEIVTPDLREHSFLAYILNPGYINPGCPAIITCHLRFIGYRYDDLVSNFFTVITIRAEFCEDKVFTHGG
jgi:hypothetical protein